MTSCKGFKAKNNGKHFNENNLIEISIVLV